VGDVEFWVYDVADAAPLGTAVTGKVFRGSLRVGDVLARAMVDQTSHLVSLRVEEIAVYDLPSMNSKPRGADESS
jgi:hypothetical protein